MDPLRKLRLTRRNFANWVVVAMACRSSALADEALFDAQGYRSARYRAVVDRLPDPAQRIDLAAVLALGADALLLDVMPAEGAVRDPRTGHWLLAQPHQTIPGALWFPETGRSPVDPALWRALMARVTAWQNNHPRGVVVVFCRADCWMSWNAARRLAHEGLSAVRWLPDGIDGWHDTGHLLVAAVPEGD